MIETRDSATLTTAGPSAGYDLAVTGIRFENGDLSRPRYLSLFDYGRAPEQVTFEPCVQIIQELAPQQTLRFLFQLDPVDGVRFQTLGGEPVVVSAVDPDGGPVPGLSGRLLDPFTCELVWDQSLASPDDMKVATLRLFCELPDRIPTRREMVYGGLYLAIVNRPKDVSNQGGGLGDPGDPEPDTIKLLGLDQQGRSVYDLFRPDVLSVMPDYLCLEPAFRVTKEDVSVELSIRLAPPLDLIQFKKQVDDPQEVQVIGFKPEGWPEQLQAAEWLDAGLRCTMVWVPEQGVGPQPGDSSSFYLEVVRIEIGPEREPVETRYLQIDPTVIQPPSCTGGICV